MLALVACKRDNNLLSEGIITRSDFRKCMCCGGWYIEIDHSTFRFYDLPENNNLDLQHETFPIYVEVSWEKDKNGCLGDEIIIRYIKKK